jgi:hypothetical protein
VPLILFVAVGISAIDVGSVLADSPPSTRGLGEAALLLLFAYAGFEKARERGQDVRRFTETSGLGINGPRRSSCPRSSWS